MKTPREVLLARHRAAEASLNQIRREVIAKTARQDTTTSEWTSTPERPWIAVVPLRLWRELVWPSRGVWASLATIWLVILGYHLVGLDYSTRINHRLTASVQELRSALEQRRALMAELAVLPPKEMAKPPKPSPQPRSERPSASICT